MKIIKVSRKKLDCFVDDDLFDWLVEVSPWGTVRSRSDALYAHSHFKGLMHRVIYETKIGPIEPNYVIDHKDRQTLNNQIDNLRKATIAQNLSNSPKPNFGRPTTSTFKGVSWNARDQRWQARISLNNMTVNLGNYKDEVEAAIAYNEAVLELRDGFGYLNEIPDEKLKYVLKEDNDSSS